MSEIKTVGKLRSTLAATLRQVEMGTIPEDKARAICRIAAQINTSFYVETKAAKLLLEQGKVVTELGMMPLGETAA